MSSKIKAIFNNSYCEKQHNKPAVHHFSSNIYHKYLIEKKKKKSHFHKNIIFTLI